MPSRVTLKAFVSIAILAAAASVAVSAAQAKVTIHVKVTGRGVVHLTGGGACGNGHTECDWVGDVDPKWKSKILDAIPEDGYSLISWSGNCVPDPNTDNLWCAYKITNGTAVVNVTAKFSGGGGSGNGATNNAAETKCPPKCAKKQLPDPHITEKLNQKMMKVQPQQ